MKVPPWPEKPPQRAIPTGNDAGLAAARGRDDRSFEREGAHGDTAKGFNLDEPLGQPMVKKKKSKKTAKKKVYYSGRKEKRAMKR